MPGKRKNTCGAKKRNSDEFCGHPAGYGTSHPGIGRCKYHGGSTPSGVKSAERALVKARMEKAVQVYGLPMDVDPQTALIQEVQRTAGHVAWLGQKVASLKEEDLTQYTGKDGMKMSEWVEMYQEERKMLVSVCKTAIQCGIAERQVKLAEDQGKMIAGILMKFINDQMLALTPEQRVYAPKLVRNLLLEASGDTLADQMTPKKIVGSEVVDVEAADLYK